MLNNGIKETTATVGTGTVTLAAVTGFARFADGFTNGSLASYAIRDGNNWEWGVGTVGAANTLARTTITGSLVAGVFTTGGTAITLASGAASVFIADHTGTTRPASSIVNLSGTNTGDQAITLTGGVTGSGTGSFAATVVTNANLTGPVTSTGNATAIANGAISNAMLANGAVANLSGTNTGDQTITLTGGVTGSGTGSFAATVVTNANLTGGVTSVGNAATVITNANLTGVVTSTGNATAIADNALSIAKTSGLQTALDGKQPIDAALTALAAGSDFVQFAGPASSTKVFTLPDASSTILVSGGALGTPSSGVATNLTGTASGLTAGTVTTNANLTGDVTSSGNTTTLTNAPVIAKVLTGYVSGAGTVAATDSILQAIQKLNGNNGGGTVTAVSVATANGVSGSSSGGATPALTIALGAIVPSAVQVSGLTASEILSTDASKNLTSLAVATYPSLTELAYVKGVTSAIQTQINTKGAGTVTSVSVTTANGVSGSVATATTTPAITLTLGAITPSTVNGNTITTGTGTLTLAAGKILTASNTLTLAGTDATTMTFPTTSATIARTDAANSFTGTNTFGSTTSLLLGTAGSAVGNIGFRNATSGTATIAPPTGALGAYSVTLPNAASTLPIFPQQVTFTGPSVARTITVPDANFTVARTDAANTFTGVQTFSTPIATGSVATMTASVGGGVPTPPNNTTTFLRGDGTFATPAGSGTVTSVGFTGGLISVATATTTPALTVAGTSGGIPYFSAASTWASSAALAANSLVKGGGAGVAPSTITTGANVLTALGVAVGSAGALVTNGGALGTPSSGVISACTSSGMVITSPSISGAVMTTMASTVITRGTAVASTSGTSISFASLPSWIRRITIMFTGVSTSGTNEMLVRLGTGAGPTYVVAGYNSFALGMGNTAVNGEESTSGFIMAVSPIASSLYSGSFVLTNITSNTWCANGCYVSSTATPAAGCASYSGGSVALGAVLTAVRVTTVAGVDTFDAGSINIMYE